MSPRLPGDVSSTPREDSGVVGWCGAGDASGVVVGVGGVGRRRRGGCPVSTVADDRIVGVQSLEGEDFLALRTVDSASHLMKGSAAGVGGSSLGRRCWLWLSARWVPSTRSPWRGRAMAHRLGQPGGGISTQRGEPPSLRDRAGGGHDDASADVPRRVMNMVRFRGSRIGIHQATGIARDDLAWLCRARWKANGELVRHHKDCRKPLSSSGDIPRGNRTVAPGDQFNAVRSAHQERRTPSALTATAKSRSSPDDLTAKRQASVMPKSCVTDGRFSEGNSRRRRTHRQVLDACVCRPRPRPSEQPALVPERMRGDSLRRTGRTLDESFIAADFQP